jgi:hypothetical protein
MSTPAQVRSTESIEALSVALARFAERVQSALDALDSELHRADDWIEHERPGHWRRETKLAEDGLHQAKLDLERALLMTTADGQRPACREQKAAVEKARAHLEYCREKSEKVRKWQRNFRHEMFEYHGRVGQLRGLLDQQVPAARALLAKIVRRLDEYRVERAPESHLVQETELSTPAQPLTQPEGVPQKSVSEVEQSPNVPHLAAELAPRPAASGITKSP